MKTRKRSQSVMLVKGVGGLDPFCRRAKDKIPIGSDRYTLVRRGGGFDPYPEDKIPIGMYWSEGLAGLIPFADGEGKIAINIVVRGGGRFDPSWKTLAIGS